MKRTRKIFGVLLTIFGATLSVLITLILAVELYDRSRYGTAIEAMWVYLFLLLAGISMILLGIRLIRKTDVIKDRKVETASDGMQEAEYKTFKSSPKEQMKVFCFIVFVPIVLIALRIVISGIDSLENSMRVLQTVLYITVPVSLLAALILSCVTYRIRVEIGDFGIRFYRGAHMYASYPLNSVFHVAQDTEDIQRFWSTYAISIGLEGQKKKRQVFCGFSRQDFWAAWTELCSVVEKDRAKSAEYQSPPVSQSFTIPTVEIKKAICRKIPRIFSAILVLGELMVVFWTGLVYLPNKEVLGAQSVYIGMVGAAVIAGVFAVIGALRNRRLYDLIPDIITFGEGWLSMGEHLYDASQIQQIGYTAVGYRPQNIGKPFYRELIIQTLDETDVYLLGHKTTVQYQVYQDYGLLVSALYDWCENSDLPFFPIPDPCPDIKTTVQNFLDAYN